MSKSRHVSEAAMLDKLSAKGPSNLINHFKTNSVSAMDALEFNNSYSKPGVQAKMRMDATKRLENEIKWSISNIGEKVKEIGFPKVALSEDAEKLRDALNDVEWIVDTIERKETDILLKKDDDEEDNVENEDDENDEDLLSGNLDEVDIGHKEIIKRKIEDNDKVVNKKKCTPSESSMKEGHSGVGKYDIEEELDDVFEDNTKEKVFVFPQKRKSSGYGSSARSSGHRPHFGNSTTIELDDSESEIMGVPMHVKDEVLEEEDEENEDGSQ